MMKKTLLSIILFLLLPDLIQAKTVLLPYQHLKTSGARDFTPFTIDDSQYIAIPQLSEDIPATPASMNGGNSDVDILIFKWVNGKFHLYQKIPGHGNEGSTFFQIGTQSYLATSSVRSGPKAPYNLHTYAKLYRWDGRYFYPIQQFFSYASKSAYAFSIGNRHFLALANGVVLPDNKMPGNTDSTIYEWNGKKFIPFQSFPTKWGYGWDFFTIDNCHYIALTDHAKASNIYRWDGKKFVLFQSFPKLGGRAFTHFTINGKFYLAYANLLNPSIIYQWNGKEFIKYQSLEGLGGRNFVYFSDHGKHYLFRINFIDGPHTNPKTKLLSPLYEWIDGRFQVIQNIITYGGVNAAVFTINGQQYLGIANSLSEQLRFRTDSIIYKINPPVFQKIILKK
ncbi:hypothetical protein [Legionella israelensis]|uniref:hypothetical protein n=1 Tax=Legionella israelensis TaxID=454 RepID=UPI001FD2B3E5|nr:hypothetical protein [Legionella israelensis]